MRFCRLVCLAGALSYTLSAGYILYDNTSELSAGSDGIAFAGPLYDSFTSNATGPLTVLQLMLDGDATSSGSVQVDLFADDSTSPGTLIANLGSVSDSVLSDTPALYVVVPAANPVLLSGTRYWIGLSGATSGEWDYDYDASGAGVREEFFSNQGGVFSNGNAPYQMSVSETLVIAEPPTSLLVFAGAALVAVARFGRGGNMSNARSGPSPTLPRE